ncbi:MAG: hypothetical protein LBV74_22580 [Tannerella sp.]|jgi:methyl-accepting chemotaxis protein|nr:hypothetical protein [Tannerella sp.]
MKKVFISMAVAAMLTLVACGGGSKSTDSAKETGKEATEKTETKSEVSASSGKLDEYIKLIEKATPLLEKVSKGDMNAVQEYTKITEEMSKLATDLQAELANSPELMKKYTDAYQKFSEEAAKLMGQQ